MKIKQAAQMFSGSTEISVIMEVAGVDVEIFKGTPAQAYFIEGEVFEKWFVWNIEAVSHGVVVLEIDKNPKEDI